MSGNFKFLKDNDIFKSFYNACIEAEKSILVSPATTAILTRRALELAVKWVYSFDDSLYIPYQDNLSSLIHDNNFIETIDSKLLPLIKYIGRMGVEVENSKFLIMVWSFWGPAPIQEPSRYPPTAAS